MSFRVKICGITSVNDARVAAEAGADAIGLNFYRGSKRHIDIEVARKIASALALEVIRVGVFVDAAANEIDHTREGATLDAIQLHGNEPPEFLRLLNGSCKIIRVRRLDERGVSVIANDLEACRQSLGCRPDAILIDAATPGQFGGSGSKVDWSLLAGYREWLSDYPLILAGGLTPDNVAEAIRIVRPHGVDVASGVESAPGKKDPVKVRDFVAAARSALAELE